MEDLSRTYGRKELEEKLKKQRGQGLDLDNGLAGSKLRSSPVQGVGCLIFVFSILIFEF